MHVQSLHYIKAPPLFGQLPLDLSSSMSMLNIHNCPLKGIGVRHFYVFFSGFLGGWEVFGWMRIEISSRSCVFRGRELRFGADS